MLRLNTLKSKPVSTVPLGNLVLFSAHNSWWAGLRVSPGRQPDATDAALIVFNFRDEQGRFPALYWPNVGDRECIDLAPAVVAADADSVLTTPAPQRPVAGVLASSEIGWTLTAQVNPSSGSDLRAWDLETGLLTDIPDATQQISGWVLGIEGIDGKFVPLAHGTTSAGLG